MEEIPHADAKRCDLPENRGKCSAGHTHIQPEDEQRIKDRIDERADEHRHHGIARAAVCQNQLAHAGIHNEERKPQRCDASVGLRVGQNIRRSAEEFQHRRQKSSSVTAISTVPNSAMRHRPLPAYSAGAFSLPAQL